MNEEEEEEEEEERSHIRTDFVNEVCPACDKWCGESGPDPCLGMLPGVNYACCGHGGFRPERWKDKNPRPSGGFYIAFSNGTAIYGPPIEDIHYRKHKYELPSEYGILRMKHEPNPG